MGLLVFYWLFVVAENSLFSIYDVGVVVVLRLLCMNILFFCQRKFSTRVCHKHKTLSLSQQSTPHDRNCAGAEFTLVRNHLQLVFFLRPALCITNRPTINAGLEPQCPHYVTKRQKVVKNYLPVYIAFNHEMVKDK